MFTSQKIVVNDVFMAIYSVVFFFYTTSSSACFFQIVQSNTTVKCQSLFNSFQFCQSTFLSFFFFFWQGMAPINILFFCRANTQKFECFLSVKVALTHNSKLIFLRLQLAFLRSLTVTLMH